MCASRATLRPMGKRPATYDDLIAAPDGQRAELIAGELVLTPRPAFGHGLATTRATVSLGSTYGGQGDGPGGWVLLVEPELWLGPPDAPNAEVLVPDLVGWRDDRFEVPAQHGHTQRPDWVCEVLSPATARRDRLVKLDVYAREGIAHAWLIDPDLEMIEAFALREGVYARIATATGDDEARLPPFDAVGIPLTSWWVRPSAEAAVTRS